MLYAGFFPLLVEVGIIIFSLHSICERVTPRLSHANAAVVLSAVKVRVCVCVCISSLLLSSLPLSLGSYANDGYSSARLCLSSGSDTQASSAPR